MSRLRGFRNAVRKRFGFLPEEEVAQQIKTDWRVRFFPELHRRRVDASTLPSVGKGLDLMQKRREGRFSPYRDTQRKPAEEFFAAIHSLWMK